ncbi:MAG: hypothetical protein LUQ31_07765 [Methanoregula sp.]|nr:hypothetical protein [Methanoregula sp.]
MDDNNREDKNAGDRKMKAVSAAVIILVIALAAWYVLIPALNSLSRYAAQAAQQVEEAQKIAAEADFNTLIKPASSDAKIEGNWSVVFKGNGLLVIYCLNRDGSAQKYYPHSWVGKTTPGLVVTWGRLKGNNELVIREVNSDVKNDKHIRYNAANDTLTYEGYLIMNRVNYRLS